MNKRNIVWGITLITFGIQASLDQFFQLSETAAIMVLVIGGLAALSVYLGDRGDWSLLIPVYILWSIAGIVAATTWGNTSGNLFPAVILSMVAAPFLATYFHNKVKNQWALIPAYVLFAIIPIILFVDSGAIEDYIPTYVMTVIAIPFLVTYYRNKTNWWALIPAYILLTIGIIVPLDDNNLINDNFLPSFILFSISLPFFYVYYRNKTNWWALIPGGITGLIGLLLFISEEAAQYAGSIVMIAAGLWLLFRRTKQPENGRA